MKQESDSFQFEHTFAVGGETEIVRAGDGVYMRSGILHSCKCIETGILIDTFTPMREDFIK